MTQVTTTRNVPFGRPWINDQDRQAVQRVLEGHILAHGDECKGFEEAFAGFMGPGAWAVSLSSCTAGLHLAYLQHGIGPGAEVLVPAQTHTATAHAVELVGARPVFVDCDPATGNVTAEALEAAITPETRALSVVHFLGLPCDMPSIMEVAQRHDLFVVEDCAIALGARIGSTHVGMFGDIGCYSFYPVKHIATGDGGMAVTRHEEVAARLQKWRAFGVDRNYKERILPGMYDVPALGLNYRMSEIQGALGRSQMDRLDENLRRRRENYARLQAALTDVEGVRILDGDRRGVTHAHYCLTIVLDDALGPHRDDIVRALNEVGIGTSIYYPQPVPRMTFYREKYGYDAAKYPHATKISDHSIALPVGPHLTSEDMDYMLTVVPEVLARGWA